MPKTLVHHKMADFRFIALPLFISLMVLPSCFVQANFTRSMYYKWGTSSQHSSFLGGGDDLTLILDQTNCGSGIESKEQFLFGSFEMLIKLVPGDSAGTVTAFYLSSVGEKHDEIDFEFLGNVSGKPYIIHTNIFIEGVGGREEQFYPWFDPSADYHNYTILWNPSHVVWYVDGIPIRVFRKYEMEGIGYPKQKSMRVYSSIWNAESWATRGGVDKIDWTKAPFVARFRNFRAGVCKPQSMSQLSSHQQNQMKWVRNKFMIYDYCKDVKRFNGWIPGECFHPQY